LPQLAEAGIEIISYQDLDKDAKKKVDNYFLKNVFSGTHAASRRCKPSVSVYFESELEFGRDGQAEQKFQSR
jgi:hypothetical protein